MLPFSPFLVYEYAFALLHAKTIKVYQLASISVYWQLPIKYFIIQCSVIWFLQFYDFWLGVPAWQYLVSLEVTTDRLTEWREKLQTIFYHSTRLSRAHSSTACRLLRSSQTANKEHALHTNSKRSTQKGTRSAQTARAAHKQTTEQDTTWWLNTWSN